MDRLKRYESLLEAHGIPLDDLDSTLTAIRNNRGLEASKPPILTEQVSSPKRRMEMIIVHSSDLESLLQMVGSKASLRVVCGIV